MLHNLTLEAMMLPAQLMNWKVLPDAAMSHQGDAVLDHLTKVLSEDFYTITLIAFPLWLIITLGKILWGYAYVLFIWEIVFDTALSPFSGFPLVFNLLPWIHADIFQPPTEKNRKEFFFPTHFFLSDIHSR